MLREGPATRRGGGARAGKGVTLCGKSGAGRSLPFDMPRSTVTNRRALQSPRSLQALREDLPRLCGWWGQTAGLRVPLVHLAQAALPGGLLCRKLS